MPDDRIIEKEFWMEFVKSPDYKYLLNVFKLHKDYLEKEALLAVKGDRPTDAIRFQAKAEDTEKIVSLIQDRIKEVT